MKTVVVVALTSSMWLSGFQDAKSGYANLDDAMFGAVRKAMKESKSPHNPDGIVYKAPKVNGTDLTWKHVYGFERFLEFLYHAHLTEIEKVWIRNTMIEDYKKNSGPGAKNMTAGIESMLFVLDSKSPYPDQKRSFMESSLELARRNGWDIAKIVDKVSARRQEKVSETKRGPSTKFGVTAKKLDKVLSPADLDAGAELFAFMAVKAGKADRVTPRAYQEARHKIETEFDTMPSDMQTFFANAEPIYDGFREEMFREPGDGAAEAVGFLTVLDALGVFDEDQSGGESGASGGGESNSQSQSDAEWEVTSGLVMNTVWSKASANSGGW